MTSASTLFPRVVRGVLFDFDGTLTRPGGIDFPKIKRAIDCPLDVPILEFIRELPGNLKTSAMETLERLEHDFALKAEPNTGALDTLARLTRLGIPFGILTRNARSSTLLSLKRFKGLSAGDFRTIICRGDARPKPDPDGVLKAAGEMRIPVDSLLMVGDFKFDMMAGRAAGAVTALLAGADQAVTSENAEFADIVLQKLTDLFSSERLILQP